MADHRHCGLFAGAAFAAVMAGYPAAAQAVGGPAKPAAPSEASNGGQSGQISEIVVTAQKRSEAVQSVPLAISAVSAATLERTGTHSFEDLAKLAPSVTFVTYGPTDDLPAIRGVVSGGGWSATTGFYVDEVPFAQTFTSGGTDLGFFDVNHVEVLRGPQGTLYGAGSMGGAVRVITNDPDLNNFGGNIELTGGSVAGRTGEFDATGAINIPLVQDRLALRLAANYTTIGDYIYDPTQGRNTGGDVTKEDFRAKLKWTPTPELSVTLTGLYGKTSAGGANTVDYLPNNTPQYGNLDQVTYAPQPQYAETTAGNLLLSYHFPGVTLTSSTSYINATTLVDYDDTLSLGTEIPAAFHLPPEAYQFGAPNPNQSVSYIEEVRLVSDSTHPFKWVAGGYIDHDDLNLFRIDRFMPGQALSALSTLSYIATTQRTIYSVFAEGTYDLTDQWHLTAGARYTSVPDESFSEVYGVAFGAAHLTPATAASATGRATSTDFSPKFELTFTPNHDMLFYAEAARGFRPGVANVAIPATIAVVPPEQTPDHLWDYELGAKTQWFGGHLVADADIYYIDWTNIQISAATAPTATTITFPYLGNAGAATIKGAELELQAVINPEWSFGLSGAYTDARFSENTPAVGVTKGERISYVPEWSGSVTADYRHPLSDSITFFAHADVKYSGDTTIGYAAIYQGFDTKPWTDVGANIGVELPGDTRLSVFVHNLTDTRAQLWVTGANVCASVSACASYNPVQAKQLSVLINQPRTVGVTVSKKF